MSIPCGFDDRGLPIGLQLQGDYFAEAAHAQRRAPVPAGRPTGIARDSRRRRLAADDAGKSSSVSRRTRSCRPRRRSFPARRPRSARAPNTQASAVDIALPGVLPVLNRGAVERAIRFGLCGGRGRSTGRACSRARTTSTPTCRRATRSRSTKSRSCRADRSRSRRRPRGESRLR